MFGFGNKGEFPQSQLIPSIIKLGDYLKKGFEHRMNSRVENIEIDKETLEQYIALVTHDWNPIVNGKPIFDDETIRAYSDGLICLNFCWKLKKRERRKLIKIG